MQQNDSLADGAGWAVGAPLSSVVADRVGRRKVTLCVLPLAIFAGCLPVLPVAALHWLPTTVGGYSRYYMLHAAARLLLGFFIGSCSCVYVLLMEYMPGHVRGRVTVAMNCCWAVVAIALAGVAALLHSQRLPSGFDAARHDYASGGGGSGSGAGGEGGDEHWPAAWQLLQLLASAPLVLNWGLILCCAPESARFLLANGKTVQAEDALRGACAMNGAPLAPGYVFPWRQVRA